MRRVRTDGSIKWGGDLFISETLIGIAETDSGDWIVRFPTSGSNGFRAARPGRAEANKRRTLSPM